MAGEVEIVASPSLTTAELAEVEGDLRGWGIPIRTSRMPARRGAELTWLLLMAIPAEVVAKAMLEKLGADVYQNLRGLVQRVFRQHDRSARGGVLVESANTGAQFALEPDLPVEAYHQLFDEIAGRPQGNGVRTFDRENQRWRL
jgi:hypothetical protein